MDANNLTGVWSGFYSYSRGSRLDASFTTTILQSGGTVSGTVHEQSSTTGSMLVAFIQGSRQGAAVQFVKTYDDGVPHSRPICYEGLLNREATEIEGIWRISRNWHGRFVMKRSRAPAEVVEDEFEAVI